MGVRQHRFGIPFWGRFTTHFRTYFSGDWDVHWGYDLDCDPWPGGCGATKMKLGQAAGFSLCSHIPRCHFGMMLFQEPQPSVKYLSVTKERRRLGFRGVPSRVSACTQSLSFLGEPLETVRS